MVRGHAADGYGCRFGEKGINLCHAFADLKALMSQEAQMCGDTNRRESTRAEQRIEALRDVWRGGCVES